MTRIPYVRREEPGPDGQQLWESLVSKLGDQVVTAGGGPARARWQAEFEWWAHAPMARDHGVATAVADAIGRVEDPPFETDDGRAVYGLARQLSLSGSLDQETYGAAPMRDRP